MPHRLSGVVPTKFQHHTPWGLTQGEASLCRPHLADCDRSSDSPGGPQHQYMVVIKLAANAAFPGDPGEAARGADSSTT